MEFAVPDRGQEERGVDVGLGDEVAEVGGYDGGLFAGIVVVVVFVGGVGDGGGGVAWVLGIGIFVRVRRFGFPFFEDGAQFVFAAEEPNTLPAIAHAGFQDPPFACFCCVVAVRETSVPGKALVQLVGFDEGLVEEFGVVELEVRGGFDVAFEDAVGVFGQPGGDGVGEPVFPDEGFADDVGVCERGSRVGRQVVEIKALVRGDLKAWRGWRGEFGKGGDETVR